MFRWNRQSTSSKMWHLTTYFPSTIFLIILQWSTSIWICRLVVLVVIQNTLSTTYLALVGSFLVGQPLDTMSYPSLCACNLKMQCRSFHQFELSLKSSSMGYLELSKYILYPFQISLCIVICLHHHTSWWEIHLCCYISELALSKKLSILTVLASHLITLHINVQVIQIQKPLLSNGY